MIDDLCWENLGYFRWTGADNFGDQPLNDFLVRHWFPQLSQRLHVKPAAVLMCIGSVLGFRKWMPPAYGQVPWLIYGTGFQYGKLEIPDGSVVLAVRGPWTLQQLKNTPAKIHFSNELPQGDPGILLPTVLARDVASQLGTHATIWKWDWSGKTASDEFSARTGGDFFGWLKKLWKFECITTDSLHAALVADAYGIPWKPLRWEPKWQDAFAPLGISQKPKNFVLCDRQTLKCRQIDLQQALIRLQNSIGSKS